MAIINGDNTDNVLDGTIDDDTINGLGGNDTITGDLGNDSLTGGTGDDSYFYTRGDGDDIIIENFNQGTDTLTFTGVDSNDVTITRDGNNLTLVIAESSPGAGDGGSVQLNNNGITSVRTGVENIIFADGVTWTDDQIRQLYLDSQFTSGNDAVTGFGANDSFTGGLGNDTLTGGTGDDSYFYTRGDGDDIIIENFNQGTDTLTFTGVDSSDVAITLDGNDITLVIAESSPGAGDGGSIQLNNNGTTSVRAGVESIIFADGVTWTDDQIREMYLNSQFTSGDDVVTGFGSNDSFTGGLGNDILSGLTGDDSYFYTRGDGDDIIIENFNQGTDTLTFTGVDSTDVTITLDGNDITLTIAESSPGAGDGGSVQLNNNGTTSVRAGVESIIFADGVTWTDDQIREMYLNSQFTSGDDVVTGFSSDDSFTGGLGNDTLTGGSGNDNYFYTRGDGEDIIIENFNQGTDTLTFTGVDSSDVTITRDGNNLTLVISESSPGAADGGSVQLNSNGNSSFKSGVDSIVFADGIIWDDPTLRQIYIDQETTSGDDIISGFDDAQVFASSLGNDTLSGDGGNDVYEYARGDGNDIIIESSAGGIDRLELLDTDSTDFDVSIDGIAITIAIAETSVGANDGGNVVLSRALGSFAQDGTESILTSDGITFTAAQLANFRSDKLGTAGEDTLTGTSGADSLSGGADNDYIIGGAGNDDLRGDAGDDSINGGLGADYLRGGVGDDELIGGEGNSQDLLSGDGGADVLDGGDGSDWAYYISSAAGLTVNLENALLNTGDAAGDSYISIENILGSNFDDNLTGDSGDNIITGSAGSDTIDGGLGIDRAVFSGSISDYILSESVGVITVTDLIGSGGTDTLTNIERLTFDEGTYASIFGTSAGETLAATTGSDLIFLRAGDDFVNASNGNDTVFGGDGNDQIIGGNGADIIDGGAGTDQARYANSSGAVFIDLAAGTASGAHAEGDTLIDIEDVFGSIHADVLTGDASDNVLTGFNGDDTLAGGEGTNTLLGGNGDDTFIGGLGADFNNGGGGFGDVIDYSGSFEGVQARLGGSQVFDGGFATGDSFQGIEDLIGSDFNDTLVGNVRANVLTGNDGDDFINGDRGNDTLLGGAGNDTIVGGFGQDTIDGGDGIDTLRYANANSRAVVDLSTGAGTAGHSFGDSITNVENLFGSQFNDVFIGDAGDNVLNGWNGVDRLTGGEGNDTLIGGAGNDRFIFTDNWDQDTITDFEDGSDLMDFRTVTGVTDFSDLTVSTDANGDAVISFGTDSITLTAIDAADIDAGDFLF